MEKLENTLENKFIQLHQLTLVKILVTFARQFFIQLVIKKDLYYKLNPQLKSFPIVKTEFLICCKKKGKKTTKKLLFSSTIARKTVKSKI